MKTIILIYTAFLFFSQSSIAQVEKAFKENPTPFSLDDVEFIVCSDAKTMPDLDVYLTTIGPAAEKYARKSNKIAYEYRNKKSPSLGFSSGMLSLQNKPNTETGKILLEDAWNSDHPVTLELEPTSTPYQYKAALSGPIETRRGWSELHHHPLNCIMRFSSFIID